MVLRNPLQRLHDLDRTSPQFHKQLIDFLRGNEYRDVIPNLRNEDLARFVEYLDSVSLQTAFPRPALRSNVGPRRNLQSRRPRVSGNPTRTREDMRHQGVAAQILYIFTFSSGYRPSVYPRTGV